jgi:hypothetical protein
MQSQVYVGLDASLDDTSLCIVNCDGRVERQAKVATDPAVIRLALENIFERKGPANQLSAPWCQAATGLLSTEASSQAA